MIPEKGKTYRIDYWFQTNDVTEQELLYRGFGKHTGETREGEVEWEDGATLYEFDMPDNAFTGYFADEDIKEEVPDQGIVSLVEEIEKMTPNEQSL